MANKPVVHVIDDDEAARQSLAFLLDCAGLSVVAYESAADFLEKPFGDDAILAAVHAALARDSDIDEARAERDRILALLDTLSPREREVLEGLVEGRANKVIAFDLDISARTVEVYRANVMTKMKAESLSDLVRMAMIVKLT